MAPIVSRESPAWALNQQGIAAWTDHKYGERVKIVRKPIEVFKPDGVKDLRGGRRRTKVSAHFVPTPARPSSPIVR
jgi:hypothetical protein